MRITGKGSSKGVAATAGRDAPAAAGAQQKASSNSAAELQSGVLQPALDSMAALPDIDHAKVAQLRDALSRGEMPFNATRLAALIQRYHGNHD